MRRAGVPAVAPPPRPIKHENKEWKIAPTAGPTVPRPLQTAKARPGNPQAPQVRQGHPLRGGSQVTASAELLVVTVAAAAVIVVIIVVVVVVVVNRYLHPRPPAVW